MIGITPYLSFPGNCKEAVDLYLEIFDGELLFIQHLGDSPRRGTGPDHLVTHCTLRMGQTRIMASDNFSADDVMHGNGVSMSVDLDDEADGERIFDRLATGGEIKVPMQATYWAKAFGVVRDRYGVNWIINCEDPDTEHQKAIT